MSEKLQKVLARAGLGSRREIETMIQAGRVSVNGTAAKLGNRLDSLSKNICIDGYTVKVAVPSEIMCRVLVYNKPEGELCTRSDPQGRRTVFDRLPRIKGARWVAVGRLDANTSGLMFFTTDGELANRLMHPSCQVQREYMVRVFGKVNEMIIKNLVCGVALEDGKARFEDVVYVGGKGMNHTFYVVITEGRNREVRRMWESQGVTVSRLKRIRYGNLYLNKELPRGGWVELELADVNYLRGLVKMLPELETIITSKTKNHKIHSQKIRRAVYKHAERIDTSEPHKYYSAYRGTQGEQTVAPSNLFQDKLGYGKLNHGQLVQGKRSGCVVNSTKNRLDKSSSGRSRIR
ncbi:23S rRNA pseudouridine(2605) synthase RluB [Candidatus Enterovibrio altilux]|uniref:Pseudouridine synthase n=1 Tax=Candidatus Enterovibrio altilux TaxID=1927128 RepID=A0A291BAK1_9GAMM|nr:23S rRNA pseudouridine(2605) synthase RluB [Candidatus Enterovibrio luxaltus]ATF10036.1 Ribosomal large subunit pseudouridine synthase B [Candidatus Enterovibrio luxaltus]